MADFDFKPSAAVQMFGGLATTFEIAGMDAGDPALRPYVAELKADLELHRTTWTQLAGVVVTLSPAQQGAYVALLGNLGQTVSTIVNPTLKPFQRRKAVFDVLESSHQFLIALPEDPVVVPPRPKGPPK